jgi:CBS domain containing-hemolysin-like protein
LAAAALARGHAAAAHGFTGRDWALLIALVLALVVAGLASASETALTSVSRIRIRNLAESGDARAQQIQRLLHEPNAYLTTILVLNNVAVIVASTLATLIAIDAIPDWGGVISTVALSLIVLILCEITPKTAAVQAPERWARALVGPVQWTSTALRPIVAALTLVTNGLIRVFHPEPRVKGPFVTEEELRMLLEVGEQEGVLEEQETEMIHNVFELGDTTAREIMVPRIDMVTIEADTPVQEAVRVIVQGGQSRIPVYSESIDNIIGVVYAKDLLRVLASDRRPPSVRSLVRQALFVPETRRLDDLLHELQREHVHMAIVLDEYTSVAGLVTIEDVVEEIIGDIQDEYDREEVLYEQLSPDEYIVNTRISIRDFNELLDTHLADEDYDTLGGFVFAQLDKIPSVGDSVTFEDLTFTVLATKGRRVTKVKVVRGLATPPDGDRAAGDRAAGDAAPAAPPAERRIVEVAGAGTVELSGERAAGPSPAAGQLTSPAAPPALPVADVPPALPPPAGHAAGSPDAPDDGAGDSVEDRVRDIAPAPEPADTSDAAPGRAPAAPDPDPGPARGAAAEPRPARDAEPPPRAPGAGPDEATGAPLPGADTGASAPVRRVRPQPPERSDEASTPPPGLPRARADGPRPLASRGAHARPTMTRHGHGHGPSPRRR